VQDIGSRHTASEYDLELVGPGSEDSGGGVSPMPKAAPVGPSLGPGPSKS
jgi:hypothetical protein